MTDLGRQIGERAQAAAVPQSEDHLLDLVRQLGAAQFALGYATASPVDAPVRNADHGRVAKDALSRVEAEVQRLLDRDEYREQHYLALMAERDEARTELRHHLDSVDRLASERNEALAEVERLKAAAPQQDGPVVLTLPGQLRLGRSHRDTVYRQLGGQPSSSDPRVAVFMGPDAERLASEYVALANGRTR